MVTIQPFQRCDAPSAVVKRSIIGLLAAAVATPTLAQAPAPGTDPWFDAARDSVGTVFGDLSERDLSFDEAESPEAAAVPDIIGMMAEQARDRLRGMGFDPQLRLGPAAVTEGDAFRVLSVSPSLHTDLPSGTPITVTVAAPPAAAGASVPPPEASAAEAAPPAGRPVERPTPPPNPSPLEKTQKVRVPDVRGVPLDEAERTLIDAGFGVTVNEGPPAPAGTSPGTVAALVPAPGISLTSGQFVTVIVFVAPAVPPTETAAATFDPNDGTTLPSLLCWRDSPDKQQFFATTPPAMSVSTNDLGGRYWRMPGTSVFCDPSQGGHFFVLLGDRGFRQFNYDWSGEHRAFRWTPIADFLPGGSQPNDKGQTVLSGVIANPHTGEPSSASFFITVLDAELVGGTRQ